MNAADSVEIVRLGYDALGERYREWSHGSSVRLRYVRHLIGQLPKNARVLDLGCGPGDPATRLLAETCEVVGVDLSLLQIGLAREAAPTAAFVVGDITHLGIRPVTFDAVASFYAFGHLPGALHRKILIDIASSLKPGGSLVANAPVGVGDGVQEWLGVQMFFGGIGANSTLAAIADAGLRVESAEQVVENEGRGHLATFLWVSARKPEA